MIMMFAVGCWWAAGGGRRAAGGGRRAVGGGMMSHDMVQGHKKRGKKLEKLMIFFFHILPIFYVHLNSNIDMTHT